MQRAPVPLGSARGTQTAMRPMASYALSQRATPFSDDTAVVSHACPPPWGRCTALTLRKTRNQLSVRSGGFSQESVPATLVCRLPDVPWPAAVHLDATPRSWLPPHHRHGGEAIEGGPRDDPRALRSIPQRPVRQIDHAHDPRLFEDERRPLAQYLGLCGQLRKIDSHWTSLPTHEREAGRIFCDTHGPLHAAGARLGERAGHPRHLGGVEGVHTHRIVGAEDTERRGDAQRYRRATRRQRSSPLTALACPHPLLLVALPQPRCP